MQNILLTIHRSDGTEIYLSQSKAVPAALNVAVFGQNEDAVQRAIEEFGACHTVAEFTLPVKDAQQRWCAMGRVPR